MVKWDSFPTFTTTAPPWKACSNFNTQGQLSQLDQRTACCQEHSTPENKGLHGSRFDLTAGPKQREKWFDLLASNRKKNALTADSGSDESFEEINTMQNEDAQHWMKFVGSKEASENFSEVMLTNQTFRDFAEAANHNEDAKKWFEDIISILY